MQVEKVLKRLRIELKIQPCSSNAIGVKRIKNERKVINTFPEKLQFNLDKMRKEDSRITFTEFRCVEIDAGAGEIGNKSAMEILQLLVNILNDENLFNDIGTAILLTINGKHCAAILVISETQIELKTPTVSYDDKSLYGLFVKLFDDAGIKLRTSEQGRSENKQYYAKDKINALRAEAPDSFVEFLKVKAREYDGKKFFYIFLGLLFEIARTEIERKSYCEKKGMFSDIPVAACIKLAMETEQTGKLKRVFGEKHSCINGGKQVTKEEMAKDRMEAAKDIILRALPHTDEEEFEENDVANAVKEIKNYYHM